VTDKQLKTINFFLNKPYPVRLVTFPLFMSLFIAYELILKSLCCWLGWYFYRFITLGQFPKNARADLYKTELWIQFIIVLTGLCLLSSLGFYIY